VAMHPGLASPWVMFHRLLLRGLRRGVKGLGMPVTFFWPCDLPTSREGSSSSGRTGLRGKASFSDAVLLDDVFWLSRFRDAIR